MKSYPSKITLLLIVLLLTSSLAVLTQEISAMQQQAEWYAKPMYISQSIEPLAAYSGYKPEYIKNAYHLPATGGAGATIAIVTAYNTSTIWSDLAVFCSTFNLTTPTADNLEIHNMSSNIAVDNNWSQETALDVEWAHAIAPQAKILLVQSTTNSMSNLLSGIDYAKGRPDVVAISMSWGGDEPSNPSYYDSRLTSNYGAVFFAASGDDGGADSDTNLCWPASSPRVVSVGGTTLNLNGDGSFVSETAWSGGGGGVSKYEAIPAYQQNYGITGSYRSVPDVAYNANPSTGVPVYCRGTWYKIGGTSAGSPQWAAIQALGMSASNSNLYAKATAAYSTYFRDITSGSNGYPTAVGYDLATGLGSPLTYNFSAPTAPSPTLEATPASGTATTNITLTANNLAGTTANIAYLNPITSTWVPLNSTIAATSGSLTYSTLAPDLMQSSPSGDHAPSYDSIIFRVTDNLGKSCTATFSEYRRGLTQVNNLAVNGVYGNNTAFGAGTLIQNGELLAVSGKWFSPCTATLLWDTTNLTTTAVDQTGTFNTTITVPQSTAGQHTITIQDSTTRFNVNVTVSPSLSNDYDKSWHGSDFTINLSADSPVNDIYYRINGGEIQNVSTAQPKITTESTNNTLVYWATWTQNDALIETAHQSITDIKLDKTAPTGQINTATQTASQTILLDLSANDNESGVSQMRFSNDQSNWSEWQTYPGVSSKAWSLSDNDGLKTVYAQFKNGAGLIVTTSCTTTLQLKTDNPTTSPQQTTSATPAPTPKATAKPATATPTAKPAIVASPTPIPEFPVGIALIVFLLASMLLVLLVKKRAGSGKASFYRN